MSLEGVLIVELISLVKWVAIGGLLISLTAYHVNRVVSRRAVISARLIRLTLKRFEDQSLRFVDYLLKEFEEKKPQE